MDDDAPPPGAPLWIVSFGDMISNMVTFFIMLAAFSTPAEADTDVTEMAIVVNEKGVFDRGKKRALVPKPSSADAKNDRDGPETPTKRSEETLDRSLDRYVSSSAFNVPVDLERLPDGLAIRIAADRMFAPGDAELKPEAAQIVEEIGRYFRGEGCDFTVEAHADSRSHVYAAKEGPLELTRSMAAKVATYLVERADVEPHRVAIQPAGASKPAATDDDAAGRAKNRRVVIYVRKPS
jgi:chemotaxis protein MotB